MCSERLYRKPATEPNERFSIESGFPIPTAARDSGHRSRTSNTNGTRLVRASHQPESPTKSCGEVAMRTSGRETNMPVVEAEAQKEL